MKVNPATPGMGGPAGAGPADQVDQMLALEQQRIEQAEARKTRTANEKNEYGELDSILTELNEASTGLKLPTDFRKMKVESSHPDLVEGEVTGPVKGGNYSLEVDKLAKSSQFAEIGYATKDETVGFGFLTVEGADGTDHEVTINPGSNIQDVANQLNESNAGVHASVLNTGIGDEPFRLIVKSKETGEDAAINLDPDTTFLEMDQTRPGQNLSAKVDDIEIERPKNKANDLIDGLDLKFKRAMPGEKIEISVENDVDATMEQIKGLTDNYNKVINFAKPGKDAEKSIANTSSVRGVVRNLQSKVSMTRGEGSFGSLAEVGITTNAKTGELMVDETKLKNSLNKDFDSVSSLFADSEGGQGVASKISDSIRQLKDPQFGILNLRQKNLNKQIQKQEEAIVKQQEDLATKRQKLTQTFSMMQNNMAEAQNQSAVLRAQLGAPTGLM